ncbi:MAG: leucine-rich repeat domain-containing protein [Treponema sp.]|jgi:hypothetical protein|nr:leucine-rich repeat domain-containing protein [Treponema sp.]
MKKAILTITAITFLLTGCLNDFSDSRDLSLPEGFGAVRISVSPIAGRTALPDEIDFEPAFIFYSSGSEQPLAQQPQPQDSRYILAPGSYEVEVIAFITVNDEAAPVANGRAAFRITAGETGEAAVTLLPIYDEGEGHLLLTVVYNGAGAARFRIYSFTIERLLSDEPEEILPVNDVITLNAPYNESEYLPAGFYLIKLELIRESSGVFSYSAKTEVVHIGKDLTTSAALNFNDSDFSGGIVTNTSDALDSPAGGSLRQAINDAPSGAIIRFLLPQGSEIELLRTVTINKSITLIADNGVTLKRGSVNDGDFTNSFFVVNQNVVLTLGMSGMSGVITLDGGGKSGQSLIYLNSGALVMNDGVTLKNNKGEAFNGGAVNADCGYFTMNGGEICGNGVSDRRGGGVYIAGGTFTMNGGEISDNYSNLFGYDYIAGDGDDGDDGGFIKDGTFTDLFGYDYIAGGGGVFVKDGTFTMNGGKIFRNSCGNFYNGSAYGGGMCMENSVFTMNGGEFYENRSDNSGGIHLYNATSVMTGGSVFGNFAKLNGGGVYIIGGSFDKTGGAIYGSSSNGQTSGYTDAANQNDNIAGSSSGHALCYDSIIINDNRLVTEGITLPTPGLLYTLIDNSTAYSVAIGSADASEVIIPAIYQGKPVTTINRNGFSNSIITNVVIPNSITNISSSAFSSCTNLTSIVIPDGVTSIDYYAFAYCSNLASVEIPGSVETISNNAFYRCNGLTSIILKEGIKKIEFNAFKTLNIYDYSPLQYVVIPKSMVCISDNAFSAYYPDTDNPGLEKQITSPIIVYYGGTETEWEDFKRWEDSYDTTNPSGGKGIQYSNDRILNSTAIYCYSETNAYGCWRFVNGVPVLW